MGTYLVLDSQEDVNNSKSKEQQLLLQSVQLSSEFLETYKVLPSISSMRKWGHFKPNWLTVPLWFFGQRAAQNRKYQNLSQPTNGTQTLEA